jgi:hypothetical protein
MNLVSKEWQGALPFTILLGAKGETLYSKQGKFKPEVLRAEIEKAVAASSNGNASLIADRQIVDLPLVRENYTYEKGISEAKRDVAEGRLRILYYGLRPGFADESLIRDFLKKNFRVEINDTGCMVPGGYGEYARGYNEISTAEIKRRFGTDFMEKAASGIAKKN